jgi:hypothetical protein
MNGMMRLVTLNTWGVRGDWAVRRTAFQYGGYLIGDRGLMASHSYYTSVISAFRSPAGSVANTSASAA